MAVLYVTGSSSAGNGYVLEASNGEQLCIEAGCSPTDARKFAHFKSAKCVGLIVSHEHLDHAKYIPQFLRTGIEVYAGQSVCDIHPTAHLLEPRRKVQIGSFSVLPFDVAHDVPCFGYIISHKDFGTLLFATDCCDLSTYFRGVNHFLIEANYSDPMLEAGVATGRVSQGQADRIRLSHLSLEHCIEYLSKCQDSRTRSITLIHLSSRHADRKYFPDIIQRRTALPTFVAQQGAAVYLL